MDDWTYSLSIPDADLPTLQPMPPGLVLGAVEDRLGNAQVGVAAIAEADLRAGGLERSWVWGGVDDGENARANPLLFATPPGAALTF